MGIAGLINHTYFSRGQSIISPKELVYNAKRKGYDTLAVTDLNSLTAIPVFTEYAYQYKIKPLSGISIVMEQPADTGRSLVPISIICKSKTAYSSLVKLLNHIPSNGIITPDILEVVSLSETVSLIGGNPNLMSDIMKTEKPAHIIGLTVDILRKANTDPYLSIDLYDYETNTDRMKSLSDELSISLVFANDVRYDKIHDFSALSDLIGILKERHESELLQNGKDANNEYRLSSSYMLSEDDLADMPVLFREYIKASGLIAENCKPTFHPSNLFLSDGSFSGNDSGRMLISEAETICKNENIISHNPHSFQSQSDYSFLEKYSEGNLLFVEQGQSKKIIKALSEKHPDVLLIYPTSYSVLEGKKIFQSVMDNHHILEERVNELYDWIKDKLSLLDEDLENNDFTGEEKISLRNYDIIRRTPYQKVPDISGYLILNKAIEHDLPVRKYKKAVTYIDYSTEGLSDSENHSLNIKEIADFSLIREIEKYITQDKPSELPEMKKLILSNVEPYDEHVFNLIAQGLTESIFMLEEVGRSKAPFLRMVESIWDIASLISGYRRNDNRGLNRFSLAKKGEGILSLFDDSLNKVLEPSSGIFMYREQAVYVLRGFGGFNSQKAGELFERIDMKEEKAIDRFKGDFVLYASSDERETKIMPHTAEKLFDNLVMSVENRLASLSNALVIALISYRFAELKLRYPLYFYISALNLNLKRHDKLQRLIEEARAFGIELVSLDINKSDKGFTISEGKIIMGLSVLLNVEEDVIDDILRVRQDTGEFKNISHFCSKINVKNLSKSLIEDLICAGAFDYTGDKRSAMFPVVKDIIKNSKKTKEEEGSSQFSLLSSDKTKDLILESANATIDNNIDEWDIGTKLRNEKDAIGFYITEHPISKYMKGLQRGDYISIQQVKQVVEGEVTVLGLITRVEERTSKSGNPWCKIRVEDTEDSIDVLAFSRTYNNLKTKFIEGKVYLFHGKVSDDQRKSIILDNLSEPDKPRKKKPVNHKKSINNKKQPNSKKQQENLSKNIETIEEKERKNGSIFKILIREKLVDYDILIKLKDFLTRFEGDKTVHFLLSRFENDTDPIELEAGEFKVTGDSNMQYQLLNEFGEYVKRAWSE